VQSCRRLKRSQATRWECNKNQGRSPWQRNTFIAHRSGQGNFSNLKIFPEIPSGAIDAQPRAHPKTTRKCPAGGRALFLRRNRLCSAEDLQVVFTERTVSMVISVENDVMVTVPRIESFPWHPDYFVRTSIALFPLEQAPLD
jgi:hypothetical protein